MVSLSYLYCSYYIITITIHIQDMFTKKDAFPRKNAERVFLSRRRQTFAEFTSLLGEEIQEVARSRKKNHGKIEFQPLDKWEV